MNTKVITVGEKLRAIRKKYQFKQYELAGNKITRNMISMIETDKAGLTKGTAEVLLQNIYKLCRERSIECDITLEYLLESAEFQAKKICDDFIELLGSDPQKVFENEFQINVNEIQKLLDKYKLKDKKLTIYLKLGKIFSDSHDFYDAYIYSLRAFENYEDLFNNPELINLIINLTYYCNNLKKYKESLDFIRLANAYMDDIPEDETYKIKFNSIIAYKGMGDYDSALKEIYNIENVFRNKLISEPTKKINIMILKANCLYEKLSYMDALQIHKKVLALTENNTELYLVTLCNILEIYIKINDSKNLKQYINKCILQLKKYKHLKSKKFSPEIYNTIGTGYYTINKFETSKVYLNKSLKESKIYKKADIIKSDMEKLLSIAIRYNRPVEVDNLKNQLIEIIYLKLMPVNNALIFQIIKYYNASGDQETINDISNFAESMLK